MRIGETLRKLMAKNRLSSMELARKTGIGQSIIHRLMNDQTDNPTIVTLLSIADYFRISVNQLIGEEPLQIQENFHDNIIKIPTLTWQEAYDWKTLVNVREGTIIIDNTPSNGNIYALKIDDFSMEPVFPKNTILIIDGDKEPCDRGFVVVNLKTEKRAIFRQILFDDNLKYLRPLHPDSSKYRVKILNKGDKYCGMLIQARREYCS